MNRAFIISQIRAMRSGKPRRRLPKRLPRPRPSTGIVLAYAADILAVLHRARDVAMEAFRAQVRPRLDADEDKINKAFDAASEQFFERLNQGEIAAFAQTTARQTSTLSKETLARQTRAALGVDIFIPEPHLENIVSGFVAENVA